MRVSHPWARFTKHDGEWKVHPSDALAIRALCEAKQKRSERRRAICLREHATRTRLLERRGY